LTAAQNWVRRLADVLAPASELGAIADHLDVTVRAVERWKHRNLRTGSADTTRQRPSPTILALNRPELRANLRLLAAEYKRSNPIESRNSIRKFFADRL
jgi:hypothetical protein